MTRTSLCLLILIVFSTKLYFLSHSTDIPCPFADAVNGKLVLKVW